MGCLSLERTAGGREWLPQYLWALRVQLVGVVFLGVMAGTVFGLAFSHFTREHRDYVVD